MKLESLRSTKLPSLAAFADKKITTGLKYIMGGATWTRTQGGHMEDTQGGADFHADAVSGDHKAYGLCKSFKSAEEWFASAEFRNWAAWIEGL